MGRNMTENEGGICQYLGRSFPGKEESKFKGPEAGGWEIAKEASVSEVHGAGKKERQERRPEK